MTPFTPQKRNNMISWLAAQCDFPACGKMLLYELPKDKLIYGPMQIEAVIDQNTAIAAQLTLWDPKRFEGHSWKPHCGADREFFSLCGHGVPHRGTHGISSTQARHCDFGDKVAIATASKNKHDLKTRHRLMRHRGQYTVRAREEPNLDSNPAADPGAKRTVAAAGCHGTSDRRRSPDRVWSSN